ncbi:MAG: hypothetical protein JRL30_18235 [Deltaproteobacteria bacterium]|nr:hypothetical protein [Deltaproteobacteria bacterium]
MAGIPVGDEMKKNPLCQEKSMAESSWESASANRRGKGIVTDYVQIRGRQWILNIPTRIAATKDLSHRDAKHTKVFSVNRQKMLFSLCSWWLRVSQEGFILQSRKEIFLFFVTEDQGIR